MSDTKTIAVDERTTYTEQRTEYVVFIPDEYAPNGRRQVGRYAAVDDEDGPGEQRAMEHVAVIHRLAAEKPGSPLAEARAQAFAVEQVITVTERRL